MSAPIALFVYRRPLHLARTLESLQKNSEAKDTVLYIYSDGARNEAAKAGVDAVRKMIRAIDGFAGVHVTCRERNLGLAANITDGISDVLARHDRVVVVEDDLVMSPFFLRFMNEALSHYQDDPRVGSISGYCYPLGRQIAETFFLRGADCWGWATWRDRWACFNPNGRELLSELRKRRLTRAFDCDGSVGFTSMLERQIAGKNESWAIRWHASCFLRNLLILYPGHSLTSNIGHDGSGTHGGANEEFDVALSATPVAVGGIAVEESVTARVALAEYFRRTQPRLTLRDLPRFVKRRALRMMGLQA